MVAALPNAHSTPSLALLLILAPFLAATAAAQDRQAPFLDLSAGWVGFADDGVVNEGGIGAAVRLPLSSRLAIGPEVVYVIGSRHSHLVLTGNLTYDLIPSGPGRRSAVTPFLVAGGGLFQTRESFRSGTFTHTEGAFTAGGGVRMRVGDRVTVGVDARVGWEIHVRVSGVASVRLGRSSPPLPAAPRRFP